MNEALEARMQMLRADLNVLHLAMTAVVATLPAPAVALAAFEGLLEQAEANALASQVADAPLTALSESADRMRARFHHALALHDESQGQGTDQPRGGTA